MKVLILTNGLLKMDIYRWCLCSLTLLLINIFKHYSNGIYKNK